MRGDYLIVGVYDDDTVKMLNKERPFMNMLERGLTILGSKYVDEVIFGPPYVVSEELMDHFGVNLFVHGKHAIQSCEDGSEPFLVPIEMGKFLQIDSGNPITTEDIVHRIISRTDELTMSSKAKEMQEIQVETVNA